MSRRFNRYHGTRVSIWSSGKWAWFFVIIILLLGVYLRLSNIDQTLSYILIASAIALGGYKVVRQHW